MDAAYASLTTQSIKLRAIPLLGGICTGLIALFLVYMIHVTEAEDHAHSHQEHAEKRAKDAAAFISSSMIVRLNLTSSLSAFVTTNRDFSAEEFDDFASLLKKDLEGVMSLQLAPNGIVTYLTDIERNKKAIGHDLLADPKRRAIAEKSIREKSYIIAGPINLIQGGRAIIARRPMFFPTQDGKTESFWGFAIVLIDVDALLHDPILEELNQDYVFALRGKNGLGAKEDIFAGPPSGFDSALAISDIYLPNASWQIAVSTKPSSLDSVSVWPAWYWIVSATGALLCSIFVYLIIDRPRQLRLKVDKATSNLQEEVIHRKSAEEHARHLAQHDSLTHLPNRRLFDELARHAITTAKREKVQHAVLFIDIDGFKGINDSLGHAAGDEVLVMIAERLLERVRESDIVARFGGDEFVIMLTEDCSISNAKQIATEIIERISEPFTIDHQIANIGASIGVAIYPDNGADIESLLKKSDTAMYEAKEAGKNSFRLAG